MFRDTLQTCNLADLGYDGDKFTRCNNQDSVDHIKARLDRFVATSEWKKKIPKASVHHLIRYTSDNLPLLLVLNPNNSGRGGKTRIKRFEQV